MISVIMATYNCAATLQRAVASVLGQTFEDWELIIVDDGSTDDTPRLLDGLRDPRIVVVRHDRNRGVAAAKNTGFDHVRGDWFTTLDADDEMVPEALAVLLECARQTGATAVTCNCRDSVTGEMSGKGLTHDGWLPARAAAEGSGEFWGLTQTSLLGDLRFDERLPGIRALWLKIDRKAKRYYLHRALRIYHTEGAQRVSVGLRAAGVKENARVYRLLGEDAEYLAALKEANPRGYRRTIHRVWVARCLRPLLRG
jgi:glycosyltransferase involved in cell wall biosynthesis